MAGSYKSALRSVPGHPTASDKPGVLSYIYNGKGDENICVTVNDISASLNEMPNEKSPGIDGFMSEHFENASYRLHVTLSVLL